MEKINCIAEEREAAAANYERPAVAFGAKRAAKSDVGSLENRNVRIGDRLGAHVDWIASTDDRRVVDFERC